MKVFRLLFLALLFSQFSLGQSWEDTVVMLDKTLSQYKATNPGCQLSVTRNGRLIYSKAVGMADLERNVPLTSNSIIEAGSVSKQFTAAAILLLEQQGKLSLNDDVRKYIPELPDYGNPIKLHHMIHHTSGFRDWGSVASLTGWERGTKFYTNNDALEILTRQKHLNNKPGDEFIYSNSNFNLFAIIVERVSGLNLATFTKKYIFDPAGMIHTSWRDDPNRIVPNRAIAYDKTDSSYKADMPNEYVYGNGGLLTTTEDLLKWNDFYQNGKLGTSSLFAKQIQTELLNNGKENNYAAGLFIKKVLGWDNISHGGATAGYRAYLETYPELNISIAVLSNTPQFNVAGLSGSVSKIFVTDKSPKAKATEKAKEQASIVLPVEKLKTFAGNYKSDKEPALFHLIFKGGKLLLDDEITLQPLAENKFIADNFTFEIKGEKGFYFTAPGNDTMLFTKLPDTKLSELGVYVGKYFSEETNSGVSIYLKDGKLMIRLNANVEYALTPTFKDAFIVEVIGGEIKMRRNAENKISTFYVSISRARDVEFKKIN
ncbi:MAG: serine hydrolase domain-containing protein [Ginsengibacter sp.]